MKYHKNQLHCLRMLINNSSQYLPHNSNTFWDTEIDFS